ncbi:MAG TPA: ABC transporter substrate-binding protein [Gemmatimonadales bacterium]|nr:ABC transporter substrate-binding protein [Gemmatimonadales bacterium]
MPSHLRSLPRAAGLRLGAALALAPLGACGREFPRQPADSPTVRVGVAEPVSSFRLVDAASLSVARFADLVYEGLTQADPAGNIRPMLATHWDISADARTFRFHLRRGVRFHDGTPFGAADVVRAWEAALREPPGAETHPYMLDPIEGAEAFSRGKAPRVTGLRVVDDSTLEVRLTQPLVLFPALLSLQSTFVGARAADAGHPLGTGPWRWVRGRPNTDDEIWLARHDGYWGAPPRLDSVVMRAVPDSLQLAAFRTHWLDFANPVAVQAQAAVAASGDVGYLSGSGHGLTRLVINLREPVFRDVRVRRALNHAIDVERLVRTFPERALAPATGAIPPQLPGGAGLDSLTGAAAGAARAPYGFDPALARRLLAEGGYPLHRPLRLYALAPRRGVYRSQLGRLIRDYFTAVGLTVEYHEASDAAAALADGRADLVLENWAADYADGDAMLHPLYYGATAGAAGNSGGFRDPVADSLIDLERREADPARRAALLREADARVFDQAANVFIWFTRSTTAYSLRLRGWQPTTYTTRYQRLELAGADADADADADAQASRR